MNRHHPISFRSALRAAAWGLLFASLPLFWACEKQKAPAPAHRAPTVTVSRPARQNVTDYLEFTGNTQAVNTVQLQARVEGYLEKVFFKDGDLVKKDQLLFLIQQNTYFANLKLAESNVMTQEAALEHAKIELARFTSLYSQKAAAQTDVETWRFTRDSAQAALTGAQAQRDLAKLNLGYTWVVAPFDGRIDRRLKDPGNLVGSGSPTVLAEISQINPLYVYFNVSETDLSRLMQTYGKDTGASTAKFSGAHVLIGLAGEQGYPHEGRLDFTSTTVTTTTGTLLVRAVFQNGDGRMLPGQFARLRVPVGEERSAILVPRVAVASDQLGSYVLVVNDKNTVERRNVQEGPSRGPLRVIEKGLTGNERVIVNGLLRAIPGRQVSPEEEAGAQQPGEAPAGAKPAS